MTGFSDRRVRLVTVAVGVASAMALAVIPAGAHDVSINFAQGSGLTERVIQMFALLTVLSLAPSIRIMMTSFTRIVVVLSLLRTALGTATAPPNAMIVLLSLLLTAFVMGPALQQRQAQRSLSPRNACPCNSVSASVISCICVPSSGNCPITCAPMPTTLPISANSSGLIQRRRKSPPLSRYLADMLGRRKLRPATVRRRFACLRAFFRQRAEREGATVKL